MRKLIQHIATKVQLTMLEIPKHEGFSQLSGIYLHDGTSFSLSAALKKEFPGRFQGHGGDAAVELHTTMDLISDNVANIILAPDHLSEKHYRPEATELENQLMIMDRAFFELSYLEDITYFGGYYIVRSRKSDNPGITNAYNQSKTPVKKFSGLYLNEVKKKLPKKSIVDFDVTYRDNDSDIRMIVFWHKKSKEFVYIATNLPRDKFCAQSVADAYRLRWQVELLFKELKSYSNLRKFNTSNQYIAEGFIWLSLIALMIKRFFSHAAHVRIASY